MKRRGGHHGKQVIKLGRTPSSMACLCQNAQPELGQEDTTGVQVMVHSTRQLSPTLGSRTERGHLLD
jgi:hypothetical protein